MPTPLPRKDYVSQVMLRDVRPLLSVLCRGSPGPEKGPQAMRLWTWPFPAPPLTLLPWGRRGVASLKSFCLATCLAAALRRGDRLGSLPVKFLGLSVKFSSWRRTQVLPGCRPRFSGRSAMAWLHGVAGGEGPRGSQGLSTSHICGPAPPLLWGQGSLEPSRLCWPQKAGPGWDAGLC